MTEENTVQTLSTGAAPADPTTPLVEVDDLQVTFTTANGDVHAVRGVSFDIYPGETVAIVGESGSGKSTSATALIKLLAGNGRISGGSIKVEGKDITGYNEQQMAAVRGGIIGYVPQDPMSNLNPVWNIGFQVREAIRANGVAKGKKDIEAKAIEVLHQAGLADAERRLKQFPHQFSGGMRQRVLIGIGLGADPKLLIADEPTSALDVTVQKVILDHLESLTREKNTAMLFITHDLGLAAERASKVIVMSQGKIVEAGPSLELLQNPQHPYTKQLIAAAPSLASRRIHSTVGEHLTDGVEGPDMLTLAERHEDSEAAVEAAPVVVKVEDLRKTYMIRRGSFKSDPLHAVDGISFDIHKGTTLALVGESGSGKSTAARLVLGLEKPTDGQITVGGVGMADASSKQLFDLRRRMQVVFQDPYASLDPQRSIGAIIAEPLKVHKVGNRKSRDARVAELLDQVALPSAMADRYPNELSGGQRQRIAIARALALKPEVVVLDEAVSALDVLVQAQVLQLLADLQAELDLTYLFITHDLAVVRVVADAVAVMEKGKIVETGATDEIFENAQQEYTQRLLDAIPGAGIEFGA
ncbi:dipeptide ABC transporter ATP-binding protein [Demequina mangrovi]|uniref:Peptide/nickel transport system ATP-binding protein n=1 Tax=Demequina mangrovi TaxID=1043493 RepID=A0A1H6YCE1_9MICO|nr:ABC transporter ATP-binding protein [Demequina mangrovi]SEJ34850.1 peptide/nickel transport system ATP-binding protein [Demequina mangrovi]